MRRHRIALIPGDGIGREVIPEGRRALDAAASRHGFALDYVEFDWSCETYARSGLMMPEDGISQLSRFDAIFLGAVGYPGVPDHVSLWGLLLPIRRQFDQYVNLRPVKLLEGIDCPLKGRRPGDIDFLVVRENTEGEYSKVGGRMYEGTEREIVIQEAVFSRHGTDRVIRYAFEQARLRSSQGDRKQGHVSLATKSNGIAFSMPFWDERFALIAADYPDIVADQYHIDILTAHFVRNPDRFDVVVASNLFGDILSDLGPAVVGGIGIAASANLNPERKFPSMFEPVHGSAPDIAGRNIANPVATVWSAAMMLRHLGEVDAADTVERAIAQVIAERKALTADLGGNASTQVAGLALAEAVMVA